MANQPTWGEVTAQKCLTLAEEKWGRGWFRMTPEHRESAILAEAFHRLLKRSSEVAQAPETLRKDFLELAANLKPSIAAIHETEEPWLAWD